ncbi:Ribonuclease/ribotoxin [Xylaria curta]|nr:Ribonuclease/ribotoxin [Xylaria curta]
MSLAFLQPEHLHPPSPSQYLIVRKKFAITIKSIRMQFSQGLVALFLFAVPALCAPVEGNSITAADTLVSRATTVTCKPKSNKSKTKTFKVSVDNAKSQAQAVKFGTGKSDYPHGFGNKEKINWGVRECDDAKADLEEYPVFYNGAKQSEWMKDTKKSAQDKTPTRVIYANKSGAVVYCGIVIHETVGSDYAGSNDFLKCT